MEAHRRYWSLGISLLVIVIVILVMAYLEPLLHEVDQQIMPTIVPGFIMPP
jgi:hypothetical protein